MESLQSRPRLLVLTSTYPRWQNDPEPGFVHELAKRLTSEFDVTVLGPHAPGALPAERMDSVDVIRYRYAPERLETLVNDGGIVTNLRRAKWKLLLVPGFVLAQAWQAWQLVRSRRIDVIHAHWLIPQGLIAAALQMLPGREIPFVVTSHGADLYALRGKMLNALKRFVIDKSNAVTVVSGAMRDKMGAISKAISKVSVLPMGVDMTGRFTPDSEVERSQEEILFVGRLVEKKGVAYLIDAFPTVLEKWPGIRLTIAGFGPDEAALKQRAQVSGVAPAVSFLGATAQEHLPELYRRAALFVAPFVRAESGDEEGLGLVLVEAIGCGCPVVAGNVPALAEVFGDDISAVAIDPHDRNGLSDKLLELLADPNRVREQARQSRERLVEKFDWTRIAERYARLLHGSCRKSDP